MKKIFAKKVIPNTLDDALDVIALWKENESIKTSNNDLIILMKENNELKKQLKEEVKKNEILEDVNENQTKDILSLNKSVDYYINKLVNNRAEIFKLKQELKELEEYI